MKALNISKEFLQEKYIKNKLSANKIAKEKDCSDVTILRYLKKHKIKIRTLSEAGEGISSGKNNYFYKDGRKSSKIYYCKDCNNEISYHCFFYGLGRCNKCANKDKRAYNYIDGRGTKKYYCKDCGKKITYQSAIYGTGRCRKCASIIAAPKRKGRKNGMFGKVISIPRIKYENIWMRSSWETAYAKYLDSKNIKWEYEEKRFYFEDCSYLPDFYLPETDEYIEIKGWWRDKDKRKFYLFKENYPDINIKLLMGKQLQEMGVL